MEAAATAGATTVFTSKLSPPLSPSASFYCHFRPVSATKDTLFFSNCSLISSSNRSNFQSSWNSEGSTVDMVLDVANVSAFTKLLLDFVSSNLLPLVLMSSVALGILNPTPGCHAHKWSLSTFSTFGIFFISGLKLKGGEKGRGQRLEERCKSGEKKRVDGVSKKK